MKFLRDTLGLTSVITLTLGAATFDSECLVIPVCLIVIGIIAALIAVIIGDSWNGLD